MKVGRDKKKTRSEVDSLPCKDIVEKRKEIEETKQERVLRENLKDGPPLAPEADLFSKPVFLMARSSTMRPLFEDIGIEKDLTFDTAEAARHVLKRWQDHFDVTAREINSGDCELFASAVTETRIHVGSESPLEIVGCEFGGYDVFHDVWGGHVWIYDHETGLHYDSEMTCGAKDWKELPLYKRRQE